MISFNVSGDITKITNALYNCPPYVAAKALDATGIAMTTEILPTKSPPYSHVTRAQAYGKVSDAPAGYFSWAQFRYVMAAVNNGDIQIPYRRTGSLELSYTWKRTGYELIITNEAGHAMYVIGDGTQSRHEKAVGWPVMSRIADGSKNDIYRVFRAAADKATKEFNNMPTASKLAAGRM